MLNYPLFVPDCKGNWIFSTDFRENAPVSNVRKSDQWKPSCSMGRADGKTDGLKLIVAFLNSANAPNRLDDVTQQTVVEIWCSWIRASYYNSYRKTQQDAKVYQNFIIPYFKWSSTCFGLHTARHQEPKTAQAASGFVYMEGCRTCCCLTLSDNVSCLTMSNNCTSDNLPCMQNQRLLVQF